MCLSGLYENIRLGHQPAALQIPSCTEPMDFLTNLAGEPHATDAQFAEEP